MPNEIELLGGSPVHCDDGSWGILGWIALDPGPMRITHLAVEGRILKEYGQLVPVEYLRATADGVRLACSIGELDAFPAAEAPATYAGGAVPITQIAGGAVQLSADTQVHGSDGSLGELIGIAVTEEDFLLTRLYLTAGHLSHKRRVSIDAKLVQSAAPDLIQVLLTRDQLKQL